MERMIHSRPQRRSVDIPAVTVMDGFDAVTGIAGRELFRQRAEKDWERAVHNRRTVTVIMFAIDHFREYSGESFGVCQDTVAEVVATHCRRRADFAGRLRAHEFAVLLSGATRQGARQLAESIRTTIEARQLKPGALDCVLTVSAGIAAMTPRPTRFVDSLLIAADAGLRDARRLGGNTVRFSTKLR